MRSPTLTPFLAAFATTATLLALVACEDNSSKPSPGVTPDPPSTTTTSATASTSASAPTTPASAPAVTATASASALASAPTVAPKTTAATKVQPKADPKVVKNKVDPKAAPKPKVDPKLEPKTTQPPIKTTPIVPKPKAKPAPPAPPPPAKARKLAPAKAGTADYVAQQVDKIYQPIKRFRAKFRQRYYAKVTGTRKKSIGVCYVQRPGKISFSYHEPNKNRVVSDGTILKIYEHSNQQMYIKKVANTEYPGALAFIMGKGLRQSFKFKFHKKVKWEGGPVIIGTPRVANPAYKRVYFYIDKALLAKGSPKCMRRVLVLDAQSNRNRFDFLHVEEPKKIPASEFSFTPPKGTTIFK